MVFISLENISIYQENKLLIYKDLKKLQQNQITIYLYYQNSNIKYTPGTILQNYYQLIIYDHLNFYTFTFIIIKI